jgi:hypothetical protein
MLTNPQLAAHYPNTVPNTFSPFVPPSFAAIATIPGQQQQVTFARSTTATVNQHQQPTAAAISVPLAAVKTEPARDDRPAQSTAAAAPVVPTDPRRRMPAGKVMLVTHARMRMCVLSCAAAAA